jgi:hypothetical protein
MEIRGIMTLGVSFGDIISIPQANIISISSRMCAQRDQSHGFGNPNVSPQSNSLPGYYLMTD